MQLPVDIDSVKGFLHPDEGAALYEYAQQTAVLGPSLELGSYCGKSTVYLGTAARETQGQVYAVVHLNHCHGAGRLCRDDPESI